jgi:Ca2+-binding RTX toxin-like protein
MDNRANPIDLVGEGGQGGGITPDVVTLSGDFTDAGTPDTHKVVIDWGDSTVSDSDTTPGDFTLLVDSTGGVAGSFAAEHIYDTGGIFQVVVTVVDDDTGSVIAETASWVTGVRVTDDGVLQIIGSAGEDTVEIGGEGGEGGGIITVKTKFHGAEGGEGAEGAEGNFSFDTSVTPITSILIHLGEQNDKAKIDKNITIPATIWGGSGDDDLKGGGGDDLIYGEGGVDNIDGGEGNDVLWGGDGADNLQGGKGADVLMGGAGNDYMKGGSDVVTEIDGTVVGGTDEGDDILVGGDGDDRLDGHKGRDLLIGGRGADDIKGGTDGGTDGPGNILVAGWTVYDEDVASLRSILEQWGNDWGAGHTYETIVGDLADDWLTPGVHVFDDGVMDDMKGANEARDAFFADLDGQHGDDDNLERDNDELVIELAELLNP